MTVAAIDRRVHHATILELDVASYRRRAAELAKDKNSRIIVLPHRNRPG